MKKIIIIISLLFSGIITMAYLYFSNLQRSTNANDLSLHAISANSGLIFSFDHDKRFYEIIAGQNILQQITGTAKAKALQALAHLLSNRPALNDILKDQKVYIGFLPGEKREIDFILCTQIRQDQTMEQLLPGIPADSITLSQTDGLTKIRMPDSTLLYAGMKGKLIVVSSHPEPARKVLHEPGKNNAFATYIKKNAGYSKNTLANVYIHMEGLSPLLKKILATSLNDELNIFNQKQTFANLSYNFSTEKLLLNGNLTVEHENSYYHLFDNIPAQTLTINTLLPRNTANYTTYAINEYQNWLTELNEWLKTQKGSERTRKPDSDLMKKYGLDLNKIFPVYFKNQFITFQLSTGEKFGAIALSNGEKVSQLLLDISSTYAPDIKLFREAGIPYAYFGEPFKKFDKPYYAIIDNFMILANHASSIKSFLNSYRNSQLLVNESHYQQLADQLSAATLSFYVDHKNSRIIFSRNLAAPYFKQYETALDDFDSFSVHLSGDKGKFLTNILLLKHQDPVILTDSLTK